MLGREGPRQGEGEPCGLTIPMVTAPGPALKSCFLLPNYLEPRRLSGGIPRLGPAPEPRHTGQGHEEGFGSGLLSLRWLWHRWDPGKHPWMLINQTSGSQILAAGLFEGLGPPPPPSA